MLDSESSNESATETKTIVNLFTRKMQREGSNLDYLLLLSLADCYSRGKPLPNASFLSGGVQDQRFTLCQIYRALNTESGLLVEQKNIGLQLRGRAVVSKAARREFDSCQPWTRIIQFLYKKGFQKPFYFALIYFYGITTKSNIKFIRICSRQYCKICI